MAITPLIREARLRAGLTQAELARRAGVAASTVGRIEAGLRAPSTDLAERLVRAAGFEIRVGLGEPDRQPTRSSSGRYCSPRPSGLRVLPERPASRCRAAVPRTRQNVTAPDRGFDPVRMLTALSDAGVRFVLIGGMAAILHGDAGVTVRCGHGCA